MRGIPELHQHLFIDLGDPLFPRQVFRVALEHVGHEFNGDRRRLLQFVLKPGEGPLRPWERSRSSLTHIPHRLHLLEKVDVHFHVAAFLGDLLGDLSDHPPHELGHRIQPLFCRSGPGQTALRHRFRRFGHAGCAAHSAHHLALELIERGLRDLGISELAGLLLGEAADHPAQEHRCALHALQCAFSPTDFGDDCVVGI